jgi:hypothetical protein
MRTVFDTILTGLICLFIGLVVGAWQSEQLKSTQAGQWITSTVSEVLGSKGRNEDSQFESYNYPTIKWRPKALSDGPDAVARLWTKYDGPKNGQPGVMKYKLTLFKATNRNLREVQLLDSMGFKLTQFNATDFHDLPGAPDIAEACDDVSCPEDQYKQARDYSVK